MRRLITAGLLAVATSAVVAEEFKFDDSEFAKKAFELAGTVEFKQEALHLRPDSTGYRLAYPGQSADWLVRSTGTLDLTGKFNSGPVVTDLHVQSFYAGDRLKEDSEKAKIMDGGVRWSLDESLNLDIGKRVQRWGKGYAWNPVGFIERPKDASDPAAAREGYVMASADWVKSMDGPLTTVGFTAAAVPVKNDLNKDFGKDDHANPAAKLYMLIQNTDIDLMWQGQGSRPASIGADFSRNIVENLEIHGEWAHSFDVQRNFVSASGQTSSVREDLNSFLLGVRYLTQSEVTWTAEYYRNGSGYTGNELDSYYQFMSSALGPAATPAQIAKAKNVSSSGFAKPNPGRDYAYLRGSVSEPFGWLYTTAALTSMANLRDGSFQITPEFAYTGIKNLEIRTRAIFTAGAASTDFGEKTSEQKFEVYARYFF